MAYVIAQLSDTHIGGPQDGAGEQLTAAISEINAMTLAPDLVLLTGDLTHNGGEAEWQEVRERLSHLAIPWEAIPGNHDRGISEIEGNRAVDLGPIRLVMLDTSSDTFTEEDGAWLEAELVANSEIPTVIAVHQPPFETGIWWMDVVGLKGSDLLESTVRGHPQVVKVLCGHVHRLIQSNWGTCSLWVCPSTSATVAVDLDPGHAPAETAEAPAFSLHAWTGDTMVSHLVPIGPPSIRSPLEPAAADFVNWARDIQSSRTSKFHNTN